MNWDSRWTRLTSPQALPWPSFWDYSFKGWWNRPSGILTVALTLTLFNVKVYSYSLFLAQTSPLFGKCKVDLWQLLSFTDVFTHIWFFDVFIGSRWKAKNLPKPLFCHLQTNFLIFQWRKPVQRYSQSQDTLRSSDVPNSYLLAPTLCGIAKSLGRRAPWLDAMMITWGGEMLCWKSIASSHFSLPPC